MNHGLTPEDEIRAALEFENQDGITLQHMKALIDEGRMDFHSILSRFGLGWITSTSRRALLRAMENMDDVTVDQRRGGPDMFQPDPKRSMIKYYSLRKN